MDEKEREILEKNEMEMKLRSLTPQGYTIKEFQESNLFDLHQKYKELLYIEDTKRIDVILATALSRKMEGVPIWLLLVGPSGDMKSVQLKAIEDDDSYMLHNLTSKTLVNGYRDKIKYPDLAPYLNNKLVIIPDMAQLLKLPPNEKSEIWGQLRDLYDGDAGKTSGQGTQQRYTGLKVTLIGGSTPAIDAQILINQDLGTRELIYRTEGSDLKEKVMQKCFENEEFEHRINTELKKYTGLFLKKTQIRRDYINPNYLQQIMRIAIYITYMRATAEFDQYTHSLRNQVYPEEPTRIAKQLKRLFVCLMSLSDDYMEERALEILWHIAKSSAFPLRVKVFEYLLKNPNREYSTSSIADDLHIGKSTAQRELAVMWNLNLISCRKEPTNYPDKTYDYWKIDKNHKFVNAMLGDVNNVK